MTKCINYAHSLQGHSVEEWQSLKEHSENVARIAGEYAKSFSSSGIASILGLIHDCGKASLQFQEYLRNAYDSEETDENSEIIHHKGPDHSSAAAQWLDKSAKGIGRLLAYVVAGHHSGLPDGMSSTTGGLENRLKKTLLEWQRFIDFKMPDENILCDVCKETVPFLQAGGFSTSFYLRMLFSCLVDADFLDTEKFMDVHRSQERGNKNHATIDEMLGMLKKHYSVLDEKVKEENRAEESVMMIRNEVRSDCEMAAEKNKGLFTLKVPTGGGKTLSSMLFALTHAKKHGMERVIYVVPFTTIIEQTANVYRDVFGSENVLEVHSYTDPDEMSIQAKLLSENWDAPIVVTTNVQFFESMFANKTSRCRKLHNYANAVIILDEAQGIPVELLKPCLKALDELVIRFGSSVVLATATLPVFFDRQILGEAALTGGTNGIVDIIPKERRLSVRLKRVCVNRIPNKIDDSRIVQYLFNEESAMIVVSTRRHAKKLYEMVKEKIVNAKVYHLSAQMCGVHRNDVLKEIKECLAEGIRCILISTQLIEAGVDIDFPCVFREIAGVDSMAQAAGRCNREGKIAQGGRVFLFESSEYEVPSGFLRSAAQQGHVVTLMPEMSSDILGEEAVIKYFELLYSDAKRDSFKGMDKFGVLTEMIPKNYKDVLSFDFRKLGETFRLIDSVTCSVIVPWDEKGRELCEELRAEFSPSERRRLARKLQRYTVSLYGDAPRDSNGGPIAEKVHDAYWILTSPEQFYSKEVGLHFDADQETLMC